MTLEDAKTFAEMIQAAATAGGIVLAGVWTYGTFIKRRERFPRGAVSHETYAYRLPDGRTLLRVAATIENAGDVLLRMRFIRTRIQQFFPMPDHIYALACTSADPVPVHECELPWTVLGAKEWRIAESVGEIEPGESEVLSSDYVLPAGVEKVLVYTFVANSTKPDSEIGWSDTALVSLKETEQNGAAKAGTADRP